jgi:hypothetical protein
VAYIVAEARPGRLDAGIAYYRALQKAEPFFAKTVAPPWHFPVLTLDGDRSFNWFDGQLVPASCAQSNGANRS